MSVFASEPHEDNVVENSDIDTNEDIERRKRRETDNVGETSVEIDVESLISELEAERASGVDEKGNLRKRLDEILEKKKHAHDLDDFDDYELED